MNKKLSKRSGEDPPVEINVTPMIDMFSVILSFLLMTAVFSATGVHVVQIPFLSSAPPDDREKDLKPTTVATLLVDNQKLKLELGKSNSSKIEEVKEFPMNEDGLKQLQTFLYEKRTQEPEFDRVTMMTADDTSYENMIKIFDAMRFLPEGTQPIGRETDNPNDESMLSLHGRELIPKIVLGNVIL